MRTRSRPFKMFKKKQLPPKEEEKPQIMEEPETNVP